MDNQYNYYKPDDDNDNAGYTQNTSYSSFNDNDEEKTRKKNKNVKKIAAAVAIAVLLGGVGGAAFQGTSYLAGKFLNNGDKSKIESTKPIGNAQLVTSKTSVSSDLSGIVSNTLPSIVSITNMSVQQVRNFFGGIVETPSESAGSGIVIGQNDKELLMVTNYHVIEGSDTLTVSFGNGTSVEAKSKGTDSARDLAVVAVELEKIPKETMDYVKVATLGDSNELNVGEPAIAIGNALGYGQSVTSGIISATKRTMEGFEGEYIQTDAAINPGNSGGALLNINGEVIGINSVKINSTPVEGMGFAIPITDARDIIQDLMNKETRSKVPEAERGYLGIVPYDVTAEVVEMYDMPKGVFVSEVVEGGGAAEAGITKGCVITKLDGSTINNTSTLQEQLACYRAGEKVSVVLQVPANKGKYTEKQVEVTLKAKSN